VRGNEFAVANTWVDSCFRRNDNFITSWIKRDTNTKEYAMLLRFGL